MAFYLHPSILFPAFPEFHRRLHMATKEYASKRKDIEASAKAEKEKGTSVKKSSSRPSRDTSQPEDPGLFGGGSSYLDLLQECQDEEEAANKTGQKKKEPSKKSSGCIILRRGEAIDKYYPWFGPS